MCPFWLANECKCLICIRAHHIRSLGKVRRRRKCGVNKHRNTEICAAFVKNLSCTPIKKTICYWFNIKKGYRQRKACLVIRLNQCPSRLSTESRYMYSSPQSVIYLHLMNNHHMKRRHITRSVWLTWCPCYCFNDSKELPWKEGGNEREESREREP